MQYPSPMPKWVAHGLTHLGLREIVGSKHNATILKWLIQLKAWWKEDETPWCGTFVGHCLKEAGIEPPKNWFRAKAYSDYGTAAARDSIPFGAVCVKSRVGGGHVFFAVAQSRDGHTVFGLGGNQGNMVSISTFRLSDIDAVRWPPNGGGRLALPIAESALAVNAAKPGSEA